MRIALALVSLALAPLSSRAAFTDFADLPPNANYEVGELIRSQGVAIAVVELSSANLTAGTGGGGAELRNLRVGPGLSFVLPATTQEMSFDYIDGAGLGLILNGVSSPLPGEDGRPFHAGFSFLDGTSMAGVDVTTTTTWSTPSGENGRVTFRGPIDSLAIAGLELIIDNVSVIVPEPGAAALLLAGIAGTHGLRRRRRT